MPAAHAPPTLNDRGSMILHVEPDAFGELPERLHMGLVELHRKVELHLTILNFGIGKLLARPLGAAGQLRDEINAAAAAHDWTFESLGEQVLLVQDSPGKPKLITVIARVEAKLEAFYGTLRELVMARARDEDGPLLAALYWPPPPHVTLYTSDPAGKQGIGLNTIFDLGRLAMDLVVEIGDGRPMPPAEITSRGKGLRAYPLAPEVLGVGLA